MALAPAQVILTLVIVLVTLVPAVVLLARDALQAQQEAQREHQQAESLLEGLALDRMVEGVSQPQKP